MITIAGTKNRGKMDAKHVGNVYLDCEVSLSSDDDIRWLDHETSARGFTH
jgi:hypothetical protein